MKKGVGHHQAYYHREFKAQLKSMLSNTQSQKVTKTYPPPRDYDQLFYVLADFFWKSCYMYIRQSINMHLLCIFLAINLF